MLRILPVLLLLAALPARAAEVRVVATLPALAALAKEVGGDRVTVISLSSPRQDPHYVDARPNLVLELNRAGLLIVNGLDLEAGWLPPLLNAARNARIQPGGPGHLDASNAVRVLDVPAGKVDRTQGDIHPGGNPHYLFDPRQGARVARAIGQRLAELDRDAAERHVRRAAELAVRLESFAAEQRSRFDQLPPTRRQVVTYHRSLTYLLDWLGLTEVATIEPRPGIPPDPGHVAEVLRGMKATGARVIAEEEFYPTRTADTLAQLTGARVTRLPGGPRFDEGQTYQQFVRDLAETLHAALSP